MDGDDLNGQGYPTLIHKLTYRRTKHHYMHVRGDKVEGTTTTPVDMVVFKDIDCFYLAKDEADRMPGLGARGGPRLQIIRDKPSDHQRCIWQYGEDMPEIRYWKWRATTQGKLKSK